MILDFLRHSYLMLFHCTCSDGTKETTNSDLQPHKQAAGFIGNSVYFEEVRIGRKDDEF